MRRALVWLTVFLALVLAGCSRSPTRRVSGEVSYEGVPIADGTIELIPIEGTGGPSVGGNITEGAYDVPADKGPLADGTYRVKLWAVRDTGRYPPGPRYAKSMTIREDIIPQEYNIQSKLQVKVNADSDKNRFDFHLKKPSSGSGK
jgi:hypothetical protein